MKTDQKPVHEKRTGSEAVTLAVFPFENLTPGADTEIFCSSFCMDLITELSRFRQFQVISLHSLAGKSADRESLQQIGTDYHIHGSFRADKEKIRVNAQLINSRSLHMVWANRFEAPLAQMMALQEELLQDVLGSLQDQLNYDLLSQFRHKEKTEFNAYEFWLHGMEELKKGTAESDEKARNYFREAIKIDPGYSLAYTGMSLTYFNDWSCQLWERWEINQNGAFEWAEKAMELDEYNYQAAAVLGRIFLYEGAYETAEHYIRRSLRLNNNDPNTLIQNAVSLVYLGCPDESDSLFQKAQRINPVNAINYNYVGLFIRIEQERFEEARELIHQTPYYPWVDANVFIASVYYHLNDHESMQKHWQSYLVEYATKISKSGKSSAREAIEWFITVNPYRGKSPMIPFLEYIGKQKICPAEQVSPKPDSITNTPAIFTSSGELWTMEFAGKKVMLPEVKGFHDLKQLLENPNQLFHCAELMDSILIQEGTSLLDEKAKKEYQNRILTLQQEIEEAEDQNDFHRASRLQQEYNELIDHLTGALGLGGKIRKSGSSIEKARSAVTWRIRSAISKIEKEHSRLGSHLANSVRTGTTCSYNPEQEISWNT